LPLRRGFSYANHPLPTLQKSRLESLGFRLASRVLAPSRSVRDVLVAEYDLDPSRIHVVGNGVAPAEFCASAASKRDQPTLLVASRLTEQKGIDHALSAFALVQRDLPSARMIIAGDGPLSSWLAAEVRRMKLRNVTLSGWVPHHEMSALYASAWVFLAPSAYEPFGLTVLEAMSAGTAVVASPFGGAPDFVRDGENGHLRIPHRSEELARTLVSLLTDPARRAQLGAAGRATAEAHSWEHTLTQLMSHYRAVATGGRP
jgi:starch synthase